MADVLTDEQMNARPLSDEEMAGAAPAPKAEEPGFLRRGIESIKRGAHDVAHVAGEFASHPIDTVSNPSKRREFERGLDSMVTLGYGSKFARRVEETNFGRAMNRFLGADQTAPASMSVEQEQIDQAAAPGYRTAGGVAGMFTPGAANVIAKGAGKVVKPLTGAIGKGAEKVAETVAKVPLAAPLARAAGGAAESAVGYEAAAPVISAASADAAGHRGEAAFEAATDPGGLLLSGALGAGPQVARPLVKKAGEAKQHYIEKATKAADEYIAKDIVGESRGASTDTARRQMSRAAQNFPDLIGRDPELRDHIAEARRNDLPKVQKTVDLMQRRLDEVTADKPQLYQEINSALPDGGVRMKDVVKAFKDDIHEWRHGEHGGEAYAKTIADELERRLNTVVGSEAYGAKPRVELPPADATRLSELEKLRAGAKGVSAEALDTEIAGLKAKAETTGHDYDPEAIVSTRQLRRLATDAQRTAFKGEGGLNGTERYERALDVATTPTKLLDAQLELARANAPDAVQKLEIMDRDTHTLLAAKTVMDQRLATAKANSTGAGGKPAHHAHNLRQLATQLGGGSGAAVLLATGHPIAAALMAGAAAAPTAQRFVETKAAKYGRDAQAREGQRFGTPEYRAAVKRLAEATKSSRSLSDFLKEAAMVGFPVADARKIYQAAHPSDAGDITASSSERTKLSPDEETQFTAWRSTLPERLRSDEDYDLRGFWRENPTFKVDTPGQHMTDKFKLPNHETFSNESKYYNDKTKHMGGAWEKDERGNWTFVPNDKRFKREIREDANGDRMAS